MSLKTATDKFRRSLMAHQVVKRYAVSSMQPGKWYKQVVSDSGEYIYFHAESEQKNGGMAGRMVRTWGRRTPKITKDSVPKMSMRLWEEVKGTPDDLENVHLAMEHSSPEARKDYLREHPNADPKNHTVKKDEGGGKSKDKDGLSPDAKEFYRHSQNGEKSIKSISRLTKQLDNVRGEKAQEVFKKVVGESKKLVNEASKVLDKLKGMKGDWAADEHKTMQATIREMESALEDHGDGSMPRFSAGQIQKAAEKLFGDLHRAGALALSRKAAALRVASNHLLDNPLDRPARIQTDGVGSRPDFDSTWYPLRKGEVPTKALEKILERDLKGPVTLESHKVHSPTKVEFKVKSSKGDYLIEVVLAEANGRKWKA